MSPPISPTPLRGQASPTPILRSHSVSPRPAWLDVARSASPDTPSPYVGTRAKTRVRICGESHHDNQISPYRPRCEPDIVSSSPLPCYRACGSDVIDAPFAEVNTGAGPPREVRFVVELVLGNIGTPHYASKIASDGADVFGVQFGLDIRQHDADSIIAHMSALVSAGGRTWITWSVRVDSGICISRGSIAWDVISTVDSVMRHPDCPSFRVYLLQNIDACGGCLACGAPIRLLTTG